MSITAKEPAGKLGLSPAAVSLALNHKKGVSTETTIKVLDAAKKYGYEFKYDQEHWTDSVFHGTIQFLIYKKSGAIVTDTTFFLELSQSIAGICKEKNLRLDIHYLYDNDLAEYHEKYADKNLELKVPERFPYEIRIDTARMTRVLDNLFTNAARYSGQGADITLGAEYDGEDVRIYVEDTGDGIASDQIPHIFERSYKASSARTPSGNSGSGLGLAIAKEIIEKHKGSITCTSQLGKGSRFTVILPSLRNH